MQRGSGRADAGRGSGITTGAVSAIVAAGGRGERAGGPKQFRLLAGRPLISWSIEVLSRRCSQIVIVAPPGLLETARTIAEEADVVPGGETRQASVANALASVVHETVLVHDGARPFITDELIERVLGAVSEADAAIPALPLHETIKQVHEFQVIETVARDEIWRVQTPQAFKTELLRRAHTVAQQESFNGTDDAQLVERIGGRVIVVEGDARNIKLTYPEDFVLAEALVAGR